MKALNKIYACIDSCETMPQFNNAMGMLMRYSRNLHNNDLQLTILLVDIQDFAIVKGKVILIGK